MDVNCWGGMNMEKKRIAALLMVLSMVLTLCACGKSAADSSESASSDSDSQEAASLNYPTQDITVIIPFDAGGNADLSMRALINAANDGGYFNGVTLVPENVGGGGAVIGQTQAFNAAPDGYTLMLYTSSVINNDVFNDTEYRYDDFLPIAGYNPDPEVVYCPSDAPYDTLQEFFDWAAKQDVVLAATPGHTTGHHIRLMNMAEDYGFNFEYIHTDSASEQLLQVMGNQVDISMNTIGATKSAYLDGSIKILAIATEERWEDLPEIPTCQECGYDLIDGADRGIAIVKGVDDAIYQYLVEEFKKVIESDAFKENMATINGVGLYKSPEEYQAYMDDTYKSIVDGLRTGPKFFVESPDVAYTLIAAFLLASILLLPVMHIFVNYMATHILRLKREPLNALIIILCVTGAFASGNNYTYIAFAVVFGIVGFLLKRWNIPFGPLVLAVVLGSMLESYYIQSTVILQHNWSNIWARPISVGLLALSVFFLLMPVYKLIKNQAAKKH